MTIDAFPFIEPAERIHAAPLPIYLTVSSESLLLAMVILGPGSCRGQPRNILLHVDD